MVASIQQKMMAYEKPLNVLWAVIALFLAQGTLEEMLLQPDANLFIWFFLHLLAATFFLIRKKPLRASSSTSAYLVALASVNYYLLYDLTPDHAEYATIGHALILLGGALCFFSTLSLGRCFGVLPVYRGIQTAWAYRVVRHPIYTSYLLLDIGILLVYPMLDNFLIFCIACLLFILRIRYEEEVLSSAKDYLQYKTKVRFKLLPKLY